MVPASGLPQRPQRALVLLLTSQSSVSGRTAPWTTQLDGSRAVGILETLNHAVKVGVSDLGPLKAPARGLGGQAGTRFCLL